MSEYVCEICGRVIYDEEGFWVMDGTAGIQCEDCYCPADETGEEE